jgi:hypothetical protein
MTRLFLILVSLVSSSLWATPIAVRHTEGVVRGFLALKSVDGKLLASGDALQSASGGKVTSRVVFHFADGSLHDETTVFTQNRNFQLVSYHLIQSGATFPRQMDVSIDAVSKTVTVRYQDKDDKPTSIEEKMDLPDDLANGMVPILLKNIEAASALTEVPMLVTTPSPRLIKLKITPGGETTFSSSGAVQKANRFNVKVDIGGFVGFLAKMVGKQPPDTSIWIVDGNVPGLIGSEGQMYQDGPIWRVELASTVLPKI